MIARAAFGNGWHELQWFLPGTAPGALPGTEYSPGSEAWKPVARDGYDWPYDLAPGSPRLVPAPDALSSAPADPGEGDGLLFGGRVAHRVADDGREVLDVLGAWNSVKNVSARIDGPGAHTFDGFVHADIDATAAAGGGLDLLLRGAKRGNLLTGAGDDRIAVETLGLLPTGGRDFRIGSGAGDDEVRFAPLAASDAVLLRGDPTYAALADGAGASWAGYRRVGDVHADLGDGDDLLYAPGMMTRARGGGGDDSIVGNIENPVFDIRYPALDSIEGGAGDDLVSGSGFLSGGEGDDALTGFGTTDALHEGVYTKTPGSGFSTLHGGAGDDTLGGVAAVMDGGDGRDVLVLPGKAGDYFVGHWDIAKGWLTFVDAKYRDGYPWVYDHSFDVIDVEVVRFAGGGPELVLA